MSNSFWDDESLTWCELDCFVFEIDQELALEHKKEFIELLVLVPVIFAFEHAESHDGVVHLAKSLVVPFVCARFGKSLNVDQLQRPVQNVQECFVRKIFWRFLRGHALDLLFCHSERSRGISDYFCGCNLTLLLDITMNYSSPSK